MRYGIICLLLFFTAPLQAWELSDVADCAWNRNPRLAEDSIGLLKARNDYDKVKYGAILPRLEASVAFGPAPGFRYTYDSTLLSSSNGMNVYARDSSRHYAWDHWGPYFGTELRLAQPLNVQQLRSGLAAARGAITVQQATLNGKREGYLKEATEYYLGYVYAHTMINLLAPAIRKLDRADSAMQEKLDNDDEDASQTDLLQLRIGRLTADKGIDEARTGLTRAEKGLRFVLGLRPEDPLIISDTDLFQFADLPPRDSLAANLRHADLRRLEAGIDAKRSLLEYRKATMGPVIAIFAELDYTKAWVANRNENSKDILVTDPINSMGGKFGLGFTWDINFWSRKRDYIGAELELEELRRKEAYARPGLTAKLDEAYARYESANRLVELTARARDAAENWLKGVALQVDADSSREGDLVNPYSKYLDLQHQYLEAVYERDQRVLDVLEAAGWLTPEAIKARKSS